MKTHIIYLSIIAAMLIAFCLYESKTLERVNVLNFNDGSTELSCATVFGEKRVFTNTQECDRYGQCLKYYIK